MTTLKPNQEVHVPESTMYWLKHGTPPYWTTLSPENVVLCIERYGYSAEPDWKADVTRAEKILDLLMDVKDKRSISLTSSITREETITNFLEGEFKTLVEKVLQPGDGTWKGVPDWHSANNWARCILSRENLKRYQLEFLWNIYKGNTEIAKTILSSVDLEFIPDYILEKMLRNITSYTDMYSYDNRLYTLFIEGLRRGMISYTTPTMVTVTSESRPTTFSVPVSTVVSAIPIVADVQEIKHG